jgi:pyruvate formate lyase activating enzyme
VEACPAGALALVGKRVALDPGRCRRHGACADVCPSEARRLVGRTVTVPDILAEVEKDRLYFDESGGGVTFSGGEPLLQWEFLVAALKACGERDLHRAVDTTGYASPEVLLEVAEHTDLFLYDIKTMDPVLHERATGVPLRPILDNLVRVIGSRARVRVRIPLIPGVTTDASLDRTGAFLATLPGVDGVNVLPYHRSAREKHARFGVPWRLEADDDLPQERAAEAAALLERYDLQVTIGG